MRPDRSTAPFSASCTALPPRVSSCATAASGVNLYSPAISRESYASAQLESLADRLTQGSLVPMITRLVEDNKLSRAEIDNLRRILEEHDE